MNIIKLNLRTLDNIGISLFLKLRPYRRDKSYALDVESPLKCIFPFALQRVQGVATLMTEISHGYSAHLQRNVSWRYICSDWSQVHGQKPLVTMWLLHQKFVCRYVSHFVSCSVASPNGRVSAAYIFHPWRSDRQRRSGRSLNLEKSGY